MDQLEKFYCYLHELDQSYTYLANLLRQKLIAVERFDINKLEEIMKEEQVYVLLSRGFESNIQSYRDKLSLAGSTLGTMITEMSELERNRFEQLHQRLKSTLDEVKGLNDKCQSVIEERLYSLDKSIKKMDKSAGSSYHKVGENGGSASSPQMFTKSI